METGGSTRAQLPRLRRPLRRGPELPLLPQPPSGGGGTERCRCQAVAAVALPPAGPEEGPGPARGRREGFAVTGRCPAAGRCLRAAPRLPSASEESTAVEKKRKPLTRLNAHSAFWILASIAVTYYFDFFKTIKETIQADSWWFLSGSCLLAACLSVAFYCILYLEWYRGIQDYDTQYPALIPITTATFIAAALCFNVALWPVWSFMTPLLLFIQFMGVVMLVSLLG
nr:transmembrane protein 128 [Columba livia]